MKFANIIFLTKKEMLALSELAGEKSICEFTEKIIRDYIITQQRITDWIIPVCPKCGSSLLYLSDKIICGNGYCNYNKQLIK